VNYEEAMDTLRAAERTGKFRGMSQEHAEAHAYELLGQGHVGHVLGVAKSAGMLPDEMPTVRRWQHELELLCVDKKPTWRVFCVWNGEKHIFLVQSWV
jgi:hypothetical protein